MKLKLLILFVVLFSLQTNGQSFNPTFNISSPNTSDTFLGGYTFSYATAGTPWNGALMSFGGFSNQYDCQISTDYGPNGGNHLSFRTRNGDISQWNTWNEVWHTGNFNPSTFIPSSIISTDSRGINYLPQDRNSGVYFDFKSNITDGLVDINTYHGVITFRPYGANADFSGGLAHQLAFTDNGNMWLRSGSNTTWLSWTKIYSDKNINRSDVDFNAKNIYVNGNVGIGTTTPVSKLDVRGVISTPEIAFRNADGGDDSDPYRLRKVQGSSNNNWLELQLNDDANESFRIYGNSCSGFSCGEISGNLYHSFDAQGNVFHSGNVGIGTTDPKSKLHIFGQENGAFNGLVIDNRKNYGVGSGIDQTSRILLSLSENSIPNPLDRIFGIIESGTLSESDSSNGRLSFYVRQGGNVNEKMRINYNGNVGIGSTNPDQKLTVKGKIHAEEIIVDLAVPADYVFQKYYTGKSTLKSDYVMPTLAEIESFAKKNHHLPNVPSAQEVQQNGVSLGTMSNVLLQKVEELTLYAIEQNKKLEEQNKTIATLIARLTSLEKK